MCKVAWYDDSNSFVAGFIDGIICLATKHSEDQVKIVEAHKVSTVVLKSSYPTTILQLDWIAGRPTLKVFNTQGRWCCLCCNIANNGTVTLLGMLKHHRCHALIFGKDAGDAISSGLVPVVPSQTEILILVSLFVKPYLLYIRWRFFFHFILSHGDSCCGIEVNLEKAGGHSN